MYQIQVAAGEQLAQLKRWEDVAGVDFWDHSGRRVMIHPELQENFENFLKANHISHELIIEDVETYVTLMAACARII